MADSISAMWQQWDEIPAVPPPPGVIPNFKNPHIDGALVVVVGSILMGITILFVANRVYSKVFITRKYSWDDRKFLNALFQHYATDVYAFK